jgi:hypothetical protein
MIGLAMSDRLRRSFRIAVSSATRVKLAQTFAAEMHCPADPPASGNSQCKQPICDRHDGGRHHHPDHTRNRLQYGSVQQDADHGRDHPRRRDFLKRHYRIFFRSTSDAHDSSSIRGECHECLPTGNSHDTRGVDHSSPRTPGDAAEDPVANRRHSRGDTPRGYGRPSTCAITPMTCFPETCCCAYPPNSTHRSSMGCGRSLRLCPVECLRLVGIPASRIGSFAADPGPRPRPRSRSRRSQDPSAHAWTRGSRDPLEPGTSGRLRALRTSSPERSRCPR